VKKLFLFFIICTIGTSLFAQKADDCFNVMNFFISDKPDSNFIKNLPKRQQQFYDESINCKAPDFKVATINGDTIELNKLKGKIVVINFWFMECAGCMEKIPDINRLVDEYKSKDIVFISMSSNSMFSINSDTISKHKLNSIIVPDCKKIADKYGVVSWPTTFIINTKGKLVRAFGARMPFEYRDDKTITGFYDALKKIIDGLL
jgi:peroxiredoxin